MINQAEDMSKLKRVIQDYRPEINFVVIFIVGLSLAFFLINTKFVADNVVKPITVAETYVASLILNHVLGFPNKQNGVNIAGTEGNFFRMEVKNNCNGVYESIVFLMAFIAIQIPWRKKMGWMMLGFAIFHFINEMRLVSLFIIGSNYSHDTFVFFHETFWNYALVIFTLALFFFCAYQVSKPEKPNAAPKEATA